MHVRSNMFDWAWTLSAAQKAYIVPPFGHTWPWVVDALVDCCRGMISAQEELPPIARGVREHPHAEGEADEGSSSIQEAKKTKEQGKKPEVPDASCGCELLAEPQVVEFEEVLPAVAGRLPGWLPG